jgi:hypothetical protein
VADGGPFDPGDEVTLEATFTVDGTLTDPTAVTCEVRRPDGTVVTPTATRDSLGKYTAKVTPADGEEGDWWYRFVGTGAAKAAERKMFLVRPKWPS